MRTAFVHNEDQLRAKRACACLYELKQTIVNFLRTTTTATVDKLIVLIVTGKTYRLISDQFGHLSFSIVRCLLTCACFIEITVTLVC